LRCIDDEQSLAKVIALLQQSLAGDGKLELDLQLQKQSQHDQDEMSLESLIKLLSSSILKGQKVEQSGNKKIKFPYSRHSSYSELCCLVEAFKPMDIFPCTIDELSWTREVSMRSLFGHLCCGNHFRHDDEMMKLYEARLSLEQRVKRGREDTQDTQITEEEFLSPKRIRSEETPAMISQDCMKSGQPDTPKVDLTGAVDDPTLLGKDQVSSALPTPIIPTVTTPEPLEHDSTVQVVSRNTHTQLSPISSPPRATDLIFDPPVPTSASSRADASTHKSHKGRRRRTKITNQLIAYHAAIGSHGPTWDDYGGLVSTRSKVDQEEQEL
jgi:hypothetical protein